MNTKTSQLLWALCLCTLLLSVSTLGLQTSISLYAADNSKDIWNSTDGGTSWTAMTLDYGGGNPRDMAHNSSGTFFIVDSNEDIYASSDGISWTKIADQLNNQGNDVEAFITDPALTLYAVDLAEDVWQSTNGGVTWTQRADDYGGGNVKDMHLNSSGTLFIIDSNEDIWTSSDNGTTWNTITTDYGGSNAHELVIDSNDTLYIIDSNEDVWQSTDQGFTWTQTDDNFNGGSGSGPWKSNSYLPKIKTLKKGSRELAPEFQYNSHSSAKLAKAIFQ